jgi:hypothetical protein
VNQFSSARAAKEFVVEQIVAEAKHQGVLLSDVERKMLYFSETDWTLRDIDEVADAFHREYDDDQYERKIAGLVRGARQRAADQKKAAWSDAIDCLSREDHYVSLMVGRSGNAKRYDRLALLAAGVAAACALIAYQIVPSRIVGHPVSRDDEVFFVWVGATAVVAAYLVLRVVFGARFSPFRRATRGRRR